MRARLKTLTTITAVLVAVTAIFVAGAPAAVRRTRKRSLRRAVRHAVHRLRPRLLVAGAATLFIGVGALLHGTGPGAGAPASHAAAAPRFRLAASSDTTALTAAAAVVVAPTPVAPTPVAPGSVAPPASDPNKLIWPAHAAIWSPFGRRARDFHTGIDIGAPYGTPIAAAQSGVVTFAGWESGYGMEVKIDHGGGISTLYAHQSKVLVAVGQHVTQGDIIGKVGNTGRVTAAHLHFEVRVNGVPQNPMRWLSVAIR